MLRSFGDLEERERIEAEQEAVFELLSDWRKDGTGITSRSYPAKSPSKTATSGLQDPVSQSNQQNRKIHLTTPPKLEASKSQPIGLTFSHSQDPQRKSMTLDAQMCDGAWTLIQKFRL